MSNQPDRQPPILNYASARVVTVSEPPPDVEALIAAGASPEDIRPYFVRSADVARCYARVMRRIYGAEQLQTRCAICDGEAQQLAMKCNWNVHLRIHRSGFARTGGDPMERFVTWHTLCHACAKKWQRRMRYDYLWRAAFGIIGMLVGIFLFVGVAVAMQDLSQGEGAVLLLAIAFLAARAVVRWMTWRCRPKPLRQLMRSGVQFLCWNGVFCRTSGEFLPWDGSEP